MPPTRYRTYITLLAITFLMLLLGILVSGTWLQLALRSQVKTYRQWHARHTALTYGRKLRKVPNPNARRVDVELHAGGGTGSGLAALNNAGVASLRHGLDFAVAAGRATTGLITAGATGGANLMSEADGRTSRLIRKAQCKLGVIMAVCGIMFLLRTLLFGGPIFTGRANRLGNAHNAPHTH